MTTIDNLWSHYRRNPFAPFIMVLQDGRRILIHRPLQFAFSESVVSVFDKDRITRFKSSDISEFQEIGQVN